MSEVKFTKEHEWIKFDGENASIGITDHAQSELGDVVFVDLPAVGKDCKQGDTLAVVESVKAASDVYAPVSLTVVQTNQALAASPDLVNQDAEGEGWFVQAKLANPAELDGLMNKDEYLAFVAAEH